MKILAICPTAGLSGVDQVFNYLCKGLAALDFDVTAVLPFNAQIKEDLIRNHVNVEESEFLRWWFNPGFSDDSIKTTLENSKPSISHILHLINSLNPDIVFSNTSVSLDGLIAAMIKGKPHLSHVHALFVDNIYTEMSGSFKDSVYDLLAGPHSAMLVPAAELKRNLEKKLTNKADKIFVVPNGVDIEKFSPKIIKSDTNSIKILNLGHFNDNKNQKLLVDIAAELRLLGENNFHFQLVGPGEGAYIAEVRKYINELNLNSHFELIDSQSNVLPLLHSADIYINSSTTETFPVSVLEAMAVALPVICTPTIGGKEIVVHGHTGYIGCNAKELAQYLLELFNEKELRQRMGEHGRERVTQNYSLDIFTRNVAKTIKTVAKNHENNAPNAWLEKIFLSDLADIKLDLPRTRIAIIIPDRSQTSYELLIRKPFDEFARKDSNLNFSVFSYAEIAQLAIEEYNLLYVFRIYADPISSLVKDAKRLDIPVIFETDDNYFALHFQDGNPVHEPVKNPQLEEIISLANSVIVYSAEMERAAKKYNQAVQRLRPYQLTSNYRQFPYNEISIGFMGSLKKDTDFEFVTPALLRLLSEFPQLSIEFFGFVPNELAQNHRVRQRDFNPNYDEFISEFQSRGWTVALAPLANTEFNRSKTNNKYREYGAACYPAVYSNIQPYADSVIEGETGLLVENDPKAWYTAIKKLLDSRELRTHIALGAFRDIELNYNFEDHVKDKLRVIRKQAIPQASISNTLKTDWFPQCQTQSKVNISGPDYLAIVIKNYQGKLCGANIALLDYIESPTLHIGVEIVYEQNIIAHLVKNCSQLKKNAVNTFNLSRAIEIDGDLEIRIFSSAPIGKVSILGKTGLLGLKRQPWVGLVSHSNQTNKS